MSSREPGCAEFLWLLTTKALRGLPIRSFPKVRWPLHRQFARLPTSMEIWQAAKRSQQDSELKMAGRCPAESSVRQKKKFPAAKSVPPHANSSVRSAAKNEAMPAGATRSDLLAHRSRLLAQADGENLQRRQNFQRPAPRARQIFARALNTVVTATHDEPMLRSPVPYEFAGRRQIVLEMAGMKGCSAKCSWNTAEARNHLNGNAPAGDLRRGTAVSVKTEHALRQIERSDYVTFFQF